MPSKTLSYAALNGQYILHKTLGTGGFAKVKLATHILTGEKVAIKIMSKEALGDDLPRIKLEMEALKELSHQNICKLYQIIETSSYIFIVLEYCPGGELFDYIIEKERLTEDEARLFFRQIVSAVAYIHKKGYAHRDLKPENLLLHTGKRLKLIDFGLCAKPKCGIQQHLETCCGSPAYAAPELINGSDYNGSKVDVWSMGVLLYALLCGFLPFDDDNVTKLYRKIQRGRVSFPTWLTGGSKDILTAMLQVDPENRICIYDLLCHPWVIKNSKPVVQWKSIYEEKVLDSECLAEMAVYYGKSLNSIQAVLNEKKFNYLTATYLLLASKKSHGKQASLCRMSNGILKESKQCNRNLLSSFGTPVKEKHSSSMDDLDDIDLLTMLSPKNSPMGVRNGGNVISCPSQMAQSKDSSEDKENFALPSVPTPRVYKKVNAKPSVKNPAPIPSGLSSSMECAINQSPIIVPFSNAPLASDKRAKSFDSPLEASSVTTPIKKSHAAWENASLSAKKVFGSIEKSLDKMKSMLTPNKRLYSCGVSVPRKVKTLCNVSAMNEKITPDELLESLYNALIQKGIQCKQKGYTLHGKIHEDKTGKFLLKFELEVCRLAQHHLVGVRRKRLVGDAWHYKRICEEVLKLALLAKNH